MNLNTKKTVSIFLSAAMALGLLNFFPGSTVKAAATPPGMGNIPIPGYYEHVTDSGASEPDPSSLAPGKIWVAKNVESKGDGTFDITLKAWGAAFTAGGQQRDPLAEGGVSVTDFMNQHFHVVGDLPAALTQNRDGSVIWNVPQADILKTGSLAKVTYTVGLNQGWAADMLYSTNDNAFAAFTPAGNNPFYYDGAAKRDGFTWNGNKVVASLKNTGQIELRYKSGSLTVTKSEADKTGAAAEYDFTISFSNKGVTLPNVSFKLKPGSSYAISNIPYDTEYTVAESDNANYITSYAPSQTGAINADNANPSVTVTNTRNLIDITGTKKWVDNDNSGNTRPQSVTVKLLRNGSEIESRTASGPSWTYTFAAEPIYSPDKKPYTYTVAADTPKGYITLADGYDITSMLGSGSVDISGAKTWDDGGASKARPESVTIRLLQNGVRIGSQKIMGPAWAYYFSGLPKYDSKDAAFVYTVEEEPVDGYTAVVNGLNITNKPGATAAGPTLTATPFASPTPSAAPTPTASPSPSTTPTNSPTPTAEPTNSPSPTTAPTASLSLTTTPTNSPSPTAAPNPTQASASPASGQSDTSPSKTPSTSAATTDGSQGSANNPTPSLQPTLSPSPAATASPQPEETAAAAPANTVTLTQTPPPVTVEPSLQPLGVTSKSNPITGDSDSFEATFMAAVLVGIMASVLILIVDSRKRQKKSRRA